MAFVADAVARFKQPASISNGKPSSPTLPPVLVARAKIAAKLSAKSSPNVSPKLAKPAPSSPKAPRNRDDSSLPSPTSTPILPKIQTQPSLDTKEGRAAAIEQNNNILATLRLQVLKQEEDKRKRQEQLQKNEETIAALKQQLVVQQQQKEIEKLQKMIAMKKTKEILQNLISTMHQLQMKEEIVEKQKLVAKKLEEDERVKEEMKMNELRHKLRMKEMEQAVQTRIRDLQEQQLKLADEVASGEAEIEQVKQRRRLTQLLERDVNLHQALLEAEQVTLDTRPVDIQFTETSKWISVDSPSRQFYTYSHEALSLSYSRSEPTTFLHNPSPFAKGTFRFAYFGLVGSARVVVKKFIFCQGMELDLIEAEESIKTHHAAEYFVDSFNKARDYFSVDVCKTYIVKSGDTVWMVEPILTGKYEKWNNNAGFVNNAAYVPNALTHFSWHDSKGAMLLVDLQGVEKESLFWLTDPAFHTSASKGFGELNRGKRGFESFFANHVCSPICIEMSLPRHPCQK